MPDHLLNLKISVLVMLLRNLNPSIGLCNGTRLIISQLTSRLIEAKVITSSHLGSTVYIPRSTMHVKNKKLPFIFKRKQFPLRICYAMTINKSQGQNLQQIGIYLPKPVFCHGQLYVGVSRVTTRSRLKILIENETSSSVHTQNAVYKEIFEDRPSCSRIGNNPRNSLPIQQEG